MGIPSGTAACRGLLIDYTFYIDMFFSFSNYL